MVKTSSSQRGGPSQGKDIIDPRTVEDGLDQGKTDEEDHETETDEDHGHGVLTEEEEDETITMDDIETMTGGTGTEKRGLATMRSK